MSRSTTLRRASAVLLLAAAAACGTGQPAPAGDAQREIEAVLQASAQAWNRSDLEGFLLPYYTGPQTTFVGADVVHGLPAIRDFYLGGWFRGGHPVGELSYDRIDVRPLGRDYALAVGHWRVAFPAAGREPRTGIFSLTFMRTPQGWRIIHDHSS